jgi:hypothetical protein
VEHCRQLRQSARQHRQQITRRHWQAS